MHRVAKHTSDLLSRLACRSPNSHKLALPIVRSSRLCSHKSMRAGSICRSCTLALAVVSCAYALARNATSPAPGPFEALTVGDARCGETQKPEQRVLPPSFTSTVEAVESPAVGVKDTHTVVEEAPKIATPVSLEPSLPIVTTRVESVQDHPELLEFPSFAEWKERHLAHAASAAVKEAHSHTQRKRSNHSHDGRLPPAQAKNDGTADSNGQTIPAESVVDSPKSRLDSTESPEKGREPHSILPSMSYTRLVHPVPHAGTNDPILDPLISLRDRTNYASFDCSATLIRSSKRTKSASAILSSKKDRYMLSPCSASEKFVITELCDEIQIDTIVLANLEFFSSMFKLFRVRAGTSYPESTGTWQELGNFRASNVRGLQVCTSQPLGDVCSHSLSRSFARRNRLGVASTATFVSTSSRITARNITVRYQSCVSMATTSWRRIGEIRNMTLA